MKLLIISPVSKTSACGNVCTVQRIQKHLLSQNVECVTCNVNAITPRDSECNRLQLENFLVKNEIDGVLFLHAYKGAKILLCSCQECVRDSFVVPYGIIFGGTDLNVDIYDKEKFSVMKKGLTNAKFAVAFTDALRKMALQLAPQLKVFVQAQAVESLCSDPEVLQHTDFNSNSLNDYEHQNVYGFIMVTGIRPVKDPMFLLEAWMKWCEENPRLGLKMLILGPIIDNDYAKLFFDCLASLKKKWPLMDISMSSTHLPGSDLKSIYTWLKTPDVFPILYVSPLPINELNTLMRSPFIFASVNSSESEGMASSPLESMVNKLPVIARDNAGNQSLVTESETGLLFHTPEEFVKQSKRLIASTELRNQIVANAFQMVSERHSMEKEKAFYTKICEDYFFSLKGKRSKQNEE